jgi:ADP-ribose pyrophosphatase
VIDIWFARGLQAGQHQLDEGEFLDVFTATPAQLLEWCRTGEVTDAKTLTCMVWLQNVVSGAWSLDWQAVHRPPPLADNPGHEGTEPAMCPPAWV